MFYGKKLADFITKLNFNDIPQNVIQRAKELMLDSLGTALAAHKEEYVLNALKTSGDTVVLGQKK
ncbi:MmgE/PrpD family protein [Campylobacter molothri]|uniref:MmgE/PrpD family protein n=1 Tax=Campylobacter molothri TaxID=1032242 RepID=UPI0039F18227